MKTIVAAALLALAAGCAGQISEMPPLPTAVPDAGQPPAPPLPDAGTPPGADSGTPMPTTDAGAPPVVDAGPPTVDAGQPPLDAGTPVTDAGTPLPWPTAGGATAVTTFQSVGLYWKPAGGAATKKVAVEFRPEGATAFSAGMDLWFDARSGEYRGSLVQLQSGTGYQIRLTLTGTTTIATLTARTWSDTFPIGVTTTLPATSATTLDITQSGTATAYRLYVAASGGSTIDPANNADFCVRITGAYVIVRGITCKNAARDGFRLETGAHDVVIENNDISGWGRVRDAGKNWGVNGDAAVHVAYKANGVDRVVIQKNYIHDPRCDSNSWADGHPAGPVGTYFENCSLPDVATCGGNHVIRWNDVIGNATHHFMDGIGGEDNFSATGFPHKDTDISGNRVQFVWDDGIESEGGNQNVRIWGNYLDETFTGIATAATHLGPIYIFRNVYDVSRYTPGNSDSIEHGPFGKLGDDQGFGGGRRYYLHNTLLQQPPLAGQTYGRGAGAGPEGGYGSRPMNQLFSRNNIWHVYRPSATSVFGETGSGNDVDYELYSGSISVSGTGNSIGTHSLHNVPAYAPGNGAASKDQGSYALANGTPGFDGAQRLPNFNDAYNGAGPDIGAAEAGAPAMKFGRAAAVP